MARSVSPDEPREPRSGRGRVWSRGAKNDNSSIAAEAGDHDDWLKMLADRSDAAPREDTVTSAEPEPPMTSGGPAAPSGLVARPQRPEWPPRRSDQWTPGLSPSTSRIPPPMRAVPGIDLDRDADSGPPEPTPGPQTPGPQAPGPHPSGPPAPGPQAPGLQTQGLQAPGLQAPGPHPSGPPAPGPQTPGPQEYGLPGPAPTYQPSTYQPPTYQPHYPMTYQTAPPYRPDMTPPSGDAGVTIRSRSGLRTVRLPAVWMKTVLVSADRRNGSMPHRCARLGPGFSRAGCGRWCC